MKRLRLLFCSILFLFALPLSIFAADISIHTAEGELACDIPPEIQNDRVFLPARSLLSYLGSEVTWQDETRSATFTYEDTDFLLTIGSRQAIVNGEAYTLDAAPYLSHDRVMLPLSFITEKCGISALWDAESRTVLLQEESISEEKLKDSVVMIRTNLMQGSGIILSADGIIATNYHVIEGASQLRVYLNDGECYIGPVTVIGLDSARDIAILQIEQTGLTPAVIGDDQAASAGDEVIVIGSPEGKFNQVSYGTISGKTTGLLASNAYVYHGSSGGALFDKNGTLLGMTCAYSGKLSLFIPVSYLLQTDRSLDMPISQMAELTSKVEQPLDLTYTEDAQNYYISWTPARNADHYELYISDAEHGSYQPLENSLRNRFYWSFPYVLSISKEAKGGFYLRVVAVNDGVSSSPSNAIYIPPTSSADTTAE